MEAHLRMSKGRYSRWWERLLQNYKNGNNINVHKISTVRTRRISSAAPKPFFRVHRHLPVNLDAISHGRHVSPEFWVRDTNDSPKVKELYVLLAVDFDILGSVGSRYVISHVTISLAICGFL